MEISPEDIPWKSMYKLMIGSILPRPIGWISSINPEGCANLAPFSFFNAVCSNPATVLFCPSVRSTDSASKDTLNNVRTTGEFVVNLVTEELATAMNLTSTEFPPEIDEIEATGLTPVPSRLVKPPRVGESPIHYECRVMKILDIGEAPGGGSIVIGHVVHLHVSDEVLLGADKIDLARLKPIGRLAGNAYCYVRDIFEMVRPPSQIMPP
jgi:flavin reductase (DIM6/NTAB) family NADH-FMN oxidoreductase RutF